MLRRDYQSSKSRHSIPNRRKSNTQLPKSTTSKRDGFIDEKLIQGSKTSPYFSQLLRDDGQSQNPVPQESMPERDVDLPLDAFDLELLAQFNEPARYQGQASGNAGLHGSHEMGPGHAPRQASQFFQTANNQRTPLRSVGSSSSEIELGSSPLTRFQSGRATDPFYERSTQAQAGPSRPAQYDISRPGISAYYNSELSAGPQTQTPFENIPVSIRGIVLVSVHDLPDNFRSIFPFPVFNAIQSKCFQPVYNSNDNIVLSSPTGSGKTVVMELAICRLLSDLGNERFKVVYQAPTKSLCSERFRDWSKKFMSLGLQCAELTGDTDHMSLRSVQNSQIIITTPEKWDSMTRKWKGHARLMQLVRLFLIDEVHILKETRGATLEAVVSRMKNIGSSVRFVALSATVPNSEDIATWLGKDATNQHVPAHREHFGEEFRPVKLQKFVYGYQSNGNDFAFDKMCNSKLADVIGTHSCRKPVMIFCCTRNSTVTTAKELAKLWSMSNAPAKLWKGPNKHLEVHNQDLRSTIAAGVAFHHAGLDAADRHLVETGFLQGQVSIICCTSTLAVGVNLPCYLVIIKNTVGWQEGGCKEYSDLEMMQMLGRAGRPQFDDNAVAVILTRKERVNHYEKLVSGSESLESCLHLNLIDHLNAEIGLGNVTNVESAVRWLAGTFLFVRLGRNPTHYKLKEGATHDDEDELLRQICEKDIKLLQDTGLVSSEQLKSTEFGDAMARYYVRYETMNTLLALKPQASLSQILSVVAQAEEFKDIRLKAGEKTLYKEINRINGIRFPVKVDIALPVHKISLLIQAELGAIDFPDGEQFQKHKFSFQQDKNSVFAHVSRLIRCIIDCQICLQDSVAIRNALELARSFGAKVWDNSPLQMKQLEQIGIVAVRKLATAGITSIEALELTEAHQIDMTLSKNPPFGTRLLGRIADFPKLRVSAKVIGRETKPGNPIRVKFKAEVAFMNEKLPTDFQRRPVYVCFLAETSDGRMIDFRRMSASKLQSGQEILLTAEMKKSDQYISCYAMCDDIAGTLRSAELKPDIPSSLFPRNGEPGMIERPKMNGSRPRSNDISRSQIGQSKVDVFEGDDLPFDEILDEGDDWQWPATNDKTSEAQKKASANDNEQRMQETQVEEEPTRLPNGKWACNHKCKDKTACKHFCCRDGLEKPPRANKKAAGGPPKKNGSNQLTLSSSMAKHDSASSENSKKAKSKDKGNGEMCDASPSKESESKLAERNRMASTSQQGFPAAPRLTDTAITTQSNHTSRKPSDMSSDYGDETFNDLPSPSTLLPEAINKPAQPSWDAGERFVAELEKGTQDFDFDDWINAEEAWPVQCRFDSKQDGQDMPNTNQTAIESPKEWIPSSETVDRNWCPESSPRQRKGFDLYEDSLLTSPEVSCGQKRKLSIDQNNESHPEHDIKRINQNDKYMTQYTGILSESQDFLQNIEVSETPCPSKVPNDWDDIDPALLEEFKDIVNFF